MRRTSFFRASKAYHDESYDPAVILEMGALGLLGPTIPENMAARARLCGLRA
jgi:hypothetical protein